MESVFSAVLVSVITSFLVLETIMEDKIIELADYFISENTTYREAKIACEKLLKQVSHEIELRAMESQIR